MFRSPVCDEVAVEPSAKATVIGGSAGRTSVVTTPASPAWIRAASKGAITGSGNFFLNHDFVAEGRPGDLMNQFLANTQNGAEFTDECLPHAPLHACAPTPGCPPAHQNSAATLNAMLGGR